MNFLDKSVPLKRLVPSFCVFNRRVSLPISPGAFDPRHRRNWAICNFQVVVLLLASLDDNPPPLESMGRLGEMGRKLHQIQVKQRCHCDIVVSIVLEKLFWIISPKT